MLPVWGRTKYGGKVRCPYIFDPIVCIRLNFNHLKLNHHHPIYFSQLYSWVSGHSVQWVSGLWLRLWVIDQKVGLLPSCHCLALEQVLMRFLTLCAPGLLYCIIANKLGNAKKECNVPAKYMRNKGFVIMLSHSYFAPCHNHGMGFKMCMLSNVKPVVFHYTHCFFFSPQAHPWPEVPGSCTVKH